MHLVSHNNIRIGGRTLECHRARYQMPEMIEGHKFTDHSILSLFPRLFCIYCGFFISIIIFFVIVFTKYLCRDIQGLCSSCECLMGMGGGKKQSEKPNQVLVSAFFFSFEDSVFLSTSCVCVYAPMSRCILPNVYSIVWSRSVTANACNAFNTLICHIQQHTM